MKLHSFEIKGVNSSEELIKIKNYKKTRKVLKKFLPPMKKKFFVFSMRALDWNSHENFTPTEMKSTIPKKISIFSGKISSSINVE